MYYIHHNSNGKSDIHMTAVVEWVKLKVNNNGL